VARQVSITKIGAQRSQNALTLSRTMEASLAGPFEPHEGLIRVNISPKTMFAIPFQAQAPENWAKQESRDFSAKFLFSRLRINCSSSAISFGLRFSSLWISTSLCINSAKLFITSSTIGCDGRLGEMIGNTPRTKLVKSDQFCVNLGTWVMQNSESRTGRQQNSSFQGGRYC